MITGDFAEPLLRCDFAPHSRSANFDLCANLEEMALSKELRFDFNLLIRITLESFCQSANY